MIMSVIKLLPTFDVLKLREEWEEIFITKRGSPINLTKPSTLTDDSGLYYGAESLYDYKQQKYVISQSDYNAPMDFALQTYTQTVVTEVTRFASQYKHSIGRVRLVALRPKECLTYHSDTDSVIRYHIPIITNDRVMFIVENEVYRMQEMGRLYSLDVRKMHTVLNASREMRLHLILDGY